MGPKKSQTQQVSSLLVVSSELPVAELPTLRDVLGKCSAEKDKLPKNSRLQEVLPVVVKCVRELYTKVNSNLVLHSDKVISQRIKTKYEEMKHINRSKTSALAKSKFEKILGEVFDVLVCDCTIISCSDFDCDQCEFDAHIICDCPKEFKIPKKELSYVLDQRSRIGGAKGTFQMKGLDLKEMASMDKTSNRKNQNNLSTVKGKEKENEWSKKVKAVASDNIEDQVGSDLNENLDLDDDTAKDKDFISPENRPLESNKMILRNLAKECDHWGVSNRAGAAIANAVLIDYGVITAENQINMIDKSKLRRALQDYRKERQAEDIEILEEKQGQAYYFDGKKTSSLCVEEDSQGKKSTLSRSWK